MRKLTPKEVTALCAALGAFALGSKHAQACDEISPCVLPQVTVQACGACGELAPDLEFTPPDNPGGPAFTPPTVTVNGGQPPPFNPANNPHCATMGTDMAGIQNFIGQNEGNDAAVQAMSSRYYGENLTNETGYVPYENANGTCPTAGPGCTSGFTTDGVDLSKWWSSQLAANGAPTSIFNSTIRQFMPKPGRCHSSPCFDIPGPVGSTALSLINAYTENGAVPLLTSTQAQQLANAALNATLGNLAENMGNVLFGQLPSNTQAALADFAWNVDSGYLTSSGAGQIVQSYVQNGEWLYLAEYLAENGGLRGGLEAGKIVQDIASGKLPEQGQPCAA